MQRWQFATNKYKTMKKIKTTPEKLPKMLAHQFKKALIKANMWNAYNQGTDKTLPISKSSYYELKSGKSSGDMLAKAAIIMEFCGIDCPLHIVINARPPKAPDNPERIIF